MRKFYLENELGERISLNNPKGIWLNGPAGQGFAFERTFGPVGSGFFAVLEEEEAQAATTGTMIFSRTEPYKMYLDFTDWLAKAKTLMLVYCPYGADEFYRDVLIDIVEKDELTHTGTLECPVTLSALTPWYNQSRFSFDFSNLPPENFKRYDYRYPYRYGTSNSSNGVDFKIGGHYPGEVILTAAGPLIAPVLTLLSAGTNEILGQMNLASISINEGESLLYSSRVRDPGVWRVIDGEYVDLIDSLELSPDIDSFIRVPPNVPVTATFAVVGLLEARATMAVYTYWRTR